MHLHLTYTNSFNKLGADYQYDNPASLNNYYFPENIMVTSLTSILQGLLHTHIYIQAMIFNFLFQNLVGM